MGRHPLHAAGSAREAPGAGSRGGRRSRSARPSAAELRGGGHPAGGGHSEHRGCREETGPWRRRHLPFRCRSASCSSSASSRRTRAPGCSCRPWPQPRTGLPLVVLGEGSLDPRHEVRGRLPRASSVIHRGWAAPRRRAAGHGSSRPPWSSPRSGRSRSRACCSRRSRWARRIAAMDTGGTREILTDGESGLLVDRRRGAGRRGGAAGRGRGRCGGASPRVRVRAREAFSPRLSCHATRPSTGGFREGRAALARARIRSTLREGSSARSTTWPGISTGCGVETHALHPPGHPAGRLPGRGGLTVPYGAAAGLRHGRVLDRTFHYPALRRSGWASASRSCVRRGESDIVRRAGPDRSGLRPLRRRDPALRAPLVMNPQGMEEHKTRGPQAASRSRACARLSREAARLADRVVATDEATRDEVPRLPGRRPGARWSCSPTGSTRRRSARRLRRTRARSRAGAAGAARRRASCCSRWAGSRPTRASATSCGRSTRLSRAPRPARRAGPGWWWAQGRRRRALRDALAARALARHVHLVGPRQRDAAARALRTRRRVRARHALRGVEPGDAGGDGPRPAGRGHPGRRHPRQGGGRARPGRWWSRAMSRGLEPRPRGAAPTPRERRREWGAEGRVHGLEHFAWPGLARRTLALYERAAAGENGVRPADGVTLALLAVLCADLLVILVTGGCFLPSAPRRGGGPPASACAPRAIARAHPAAASAARARPGAAAGRRDAPPPALLLLPTLMQFQFAAAGSTATASCTTSTSGRCGRTSTSTSPTSTRTTA